MQMRSGITSGALMLLLFIALPAFAHPPVSVVVDAQGNAYYSDLTHVWKVAPNGTKSIAVRNVHTHELYMDARGNLYGEHLWYEGDATKKWGHFVWRRGADGKVVAITHRREGFLTDMSFVRDAAGNMYMADTSRRNVLRRAPNGTVTTIARGLGRIGWMTAAADGTVFLIDETDVVRIRASRADRIASKITRTSLLRPTADRHALMGLWLDRAGNVYVADAAQGRVQRISTDGRVTIVARSSQPWMPTGGTFAANGDLLLLEASLTNDVRLRRIRLQ